MKATNSVGTEQQKNTKRVGKMISTEVDIAAPPSVVWRVLMDFASYPSWNPFIREIASSAAATSAGDGEAAPPLAEGDGLTVLIGAEGKSPMKFTPVVVSLKENEEFKWQGKFGFKGVFDGKHQFVLEPLDGGARTRFRHFEEFEGFFSSPILYFIRDDTQKGFEAMNEALKARCAATATAAGKA